MDTWRSDVLNPGMTFLCCRSHTNGPLRLICQGADVPVGEKVAQDGTQTDHKQMLPFICWPHTLTEGLYPSHQQPLQVGPVHFCPSV